MIRRTAKPSVSHERDKLSVEVFNSCRVILRIGLGVVRDRWAMLQKAAAHCPSESRFAVEGGQFVEHTVRFFKPGIAVVQIAGPHPVNALT